MTDHFRVKIEDTESFQQILSQIYAINDETVDFKRANLAPEHVADSLPHAGRNSSANPLSRLLLSLHSEVEFHKDGTKYAQPEILPLPDETMFDLEMHICPRSASLELKVGFAADLLKPATIKSLLSIFHQVIDQGIRCPDTPVETLNLMTEEDYDVLRRMDLLSPQTTAYPRDATVVDIFQQQVKASPDFIAFKDTSSQLTYTELNKQSDILALWLRHQELPLEALVGVFAPRSCQVIIAFIGILKAGLAYLPFDTTTPHNRIKTILSSLKGRTVVLTGSVALVPSSGNNIEFVKISDILEGPAATPELLDEPCAQEQITPTNLAYVMFTSGSTGRPKGVMVEHRGIVRLVKGSNMAEHLPRRTVMAHLTSIAFDNSTWEIYAALLTGGTLVCVDATTVLDCSAITQTFTREQVQSTMLTPALLKQYLVGCPDAIAVLKMMCIQGEKAIVEDMFLAKQLSGGTVINAYGPTENTVTSSFFVVDDAEPCTNGVPIGCPISNSGVHVMDSKQRPVLLGVIGELVVMGDGLARGYDDPERNLESFISITVNDCTIPAYRTGDYVRHRPTDGQLEFFGRIDGQVKIHGNRIELEEIEHVIRSHQHVRDAVVVVQSEDQDPRLAAYLTLGEVRPGSIEESTLVETWLDHWDAKTYTPITKIQLEDIGRDFIGWTSMHDGTDIPRAEMNEWLDETIDTILDGGAAGHILEIGTGSGMILFNLGHGLESYMGIEPSERAVNFVNRAAALMPEFVNKVKMHRGTAGDLDQVNITNSPDTAILNSVIQYFPSQDYLLSVIQSLIKIGAKKIFLGDVRSYALHREFLAARALFIVGDSHVSPAEFRRIMSDIEKAESELLLDPAFFTNLPGHLPNIFHVEILSKRMQAINELSCYRYNVVLHVKHNPLTTSAHFPDINYEARINFRDKNLDYKSLLHLLNSSHESAMLFVESIPGSKTSLERGVIGLLDRFEQSADTDAEEIWLERARQQAKLQSSMSTTDLVMLAEQTGWQIELSWARHGTQTGSIDAVFYRGHSATRSSGRVKFRFPVGDHSRPNSTLSSHPLRREVRRKVQDQLQRLLQDTLPSYMMPQFFTFLDKLPVNQNSKID
jgi:amino acid adenylation domain-containing protein